MLLSGTAWTSAAVVGSMSASVAASGATPSSSRSRCISAAWCRSANFDRRQAAGCGSNADNTPRSADRARQGVPRELSRQNVRRRRSCPARGVPAQCISRPLSASRRKNAQSSNSGTIGQRESRRGSHRDKRRQASSKALRRRRSEQMRVDLQFDRRRPPHAGAVGLEKCAGRA